MALMQCLQGRQDETDDLIRRNISSLVGDDLQRTKSFRAAFGDQDVVSLPNRVRETLLKARATRADGLCYLDLPCVPCAPSFFFPAEVGEAPQEVRNQVLGLLVEASDCLDALDAAVGWWPKHAAAKIVPLYTSADLNCLLHACSLALAGVRDTLAMREAEGRCLLRDALHASLAGCPALRQASLRPAGGDGAPERWPEVLASAQKNRTALDGSHMLALACTLRRPLVCHATVEHEGGEVRHVLEVPFRMSGVYLPLLWDPSSCSPDPLVLAYTRGHFTALCPVRPAAGKVDIPLYDAEGAPLPVPFAAAALAGESGGSWMGWAGAPPAAAAGATCPSRDCRELLQRYLRLEGRKRGLVAVLQLPPSVASKERCGTPLETYCHIIGSVVLKKLRQT